MMQRAYTRTKWQEDAECIGLPDFADQEEDYQLLYCERCPVVAQCLDYALDYERQHRLPIVAQRVSDWPVYGGKTAAERIDIVAKERSEARRAAK